MDVIHENASSRPEFSAEDRMELYRLLNQCSRMIEQTLDLTDEDWLIERHIALGNYEGRPYDLTTLSQAVDMPRTTVSRRVAKLVELGFHERVYQGRRATFRETERVQEDIAPAVDQMIRLLMAYVNQLEAKTAPSPVLQPAPNGAEQRPGTAH